MFKLQVLIIPQSAISTVDSSGCGTANTGSDNATNVDNIDNIDSNLNNSKSINSGNHSIFRTYSSSPGPGSERALNAISTPIPPNQYSLQRLQSFNPNNSFVTYPNSFLSMPSNKSNNFRIKKFLHITYSSNRLETIAQEISQRFLKLYPNEEPLQIVNIQDFEECDLDPDYTAEMVFDNSNICRVIVANEFSESDDAFINSNGKRHLAGDLNSVMKKVRKPKRSQLHHAENTSQMNSSIWSSHEDPQSAHSHHYPSGHNTLSYNAKNKPLGMKEDASTSGPNISLAIPDVDDTVVHPHKRDHLKIASPIVATGSPTRITSGMLNVQSQPDLSKVDYEEDINGSMYIEQEGKRASVSTKEDAMRNRSTKTSSNPLVTKNIDDSSFINNADLSSSSLNVSTQNIAASAFKTPESNKTGLLSMTNKRSVPSDQPTNGSSLENDNKKQKTQVYNPSSPTTITDKAAARLDRPTLIHQDTSPAVALSVDGINTSGALNNTEINKSTTDESEKSKENVAVKKKITKGDASEVKAAREKAAREKAEKVAKDKAAKEKAAKEKAEKVARDKAAKEKAAKEKAEKAARDKAAKEKAAKEKAEKIAKEKAEKERIAKEKAEKAAKDKLAKEKAAKEKAEKIARDKAEKERLAKEKAEKIAKDKAEKERVAKEKAEKAAKDKAEKEKAAKEKVERIAQEIAEKAAKEKKERAAKDKAEKEQLAKEKAAKEKVQKEKIVKEKAGKEEKSTSKSIKITAKETPDATATRLAGADTTHKRPRRASKNSDVIVIDATPEADQGARILKKPSNAVAVDVDSDNILTDTEDDEDINKIRTLTRDDTPEDEKLNHPAKAVKVTKLSVTPAESKLPKKSTIEPAKPQTSSSGTSDNSASTPSDASPNSATVSTEASPVKIGGDSVVKGEMFSAQAISKIIQKENAKINDNAARHDEISGDIDLSNILPQKNRSVKPASANIAKTNKSSETGSSSNTSSDSDSSSDSSSESGSGSSSDSSSDSESSDDSSEDESSKPKIVPAPRTSSKAAALSQGKVETTKKPATAPPKVPLSKSSQSSPPKPAPYVKPMAQSKSQISAPVELSKRSSLPRLSAFLDKKLPEVRMQKKAPTKTESTESETSDSDSSGSDSSSASDSDSDTDTASDSSDSDSKDGDAAKTKFINARTANQFVATKKSKSKAKKNKGFSALMKDSKK